MILTRGILGRVIEWADVQTVFGSQPQMHPQIQANATNRDVYDLSFAHIACSLGVPACSS